MTALGPVSSVNELWSPGLFFLAPDPMISLTPPLISRCFCKCWKWDMEMPAVCLSHLRVRLHLVLNHRASQREVGSETAPHRVLKPESGNQGESQRFLESQNQHTPLLLLHFSAAWPPPSLHSEFLCLSTWGRNCPIQL